MIAATVPVGPIDPPITVRDGTNTVQLVRRHRSPKGKVTFTYRAAGRVGMATIDDTERLAVTRPH